MYTAVEFQDATDIELQMAARFADASECPKLQTMIERIDLRERDREVLREYLIDKGYKSLLIETARLHGAARNVQFSTALPFTHGAKVANRGQALLTELGFLGVTQMLSFGAPSLRYTVSQSFESVVEILQSHHEMWDFDLSDIKPNLVCRDGRYDDYLYDVRSGGLLVGRLTVRRYTDERSVSHIELHPLSN